MPTRADTAPTSSPPTTKGLLEQIVASLVAPPAVPGAPAVPVPTPAAAPVSPPVVAARPASTTSPAARPTVKAAAVVPASPRLPVTGPRSGPRNTAALMEAVGRLEEAGVGRDDAMRIGMGAFPVAGRANYTDDWGAPRYSPTYHPHRGTDIFAVRGTPVRSPADGSVRFTHDAAGGKSAYVKTSDGTFYYMTHLNGFNMALRSGARVKQGDVVGFVGSSGNADAGSPHLHFEIHPRGGGAVNPKPFLDAWQAEAIAGVPVLVAARQAEMSGVSPVVPPAVVPTSPAPFGGRRGEELRIAGDTARALLLPLTPGALAPLLGTLR
ncbi:MAG: peptidoglycan DD-metalloendopeptidase family protein [Acidimicrobiales bacterium]